MNNCIRNPSTTDARTPYVAACGVSDRVLWQILKDRSYIKKVYLCFDNDEKGQQAAQRISRQLTERNISNELLTPAAKDWNEELICLRKGQGK